MDAASRSGMLMACLFFGMMGWGGCTSRQPDHPARTAADTLRIMTYNVADLRTADLKHAGHPRLRRAAAVIQHLRPDILLLNEIAYDPEAENALRFAQHFLGDPQADSLRPIDFDVFTASVNTGLSSGFDLNRDGLTVTRYPTPPDTITPDAQPLPQTEEGRAYGEDAWGFGTFPGQYGMALLVSGKLKLIEEDVRTFRLLRWITMPENYMPRDPVTDTSWYEEEAEMAFRLSSKSHWDVPVRLPSGSVLHVLASHPRPPTFDGEEQRNVRRNYDEIRFWADYLDQADYIKDDSSRQGGLPDGVPFVIMGDLNADPEEVSELGSPVSDLLLDHDRITGDFVPRANAWGRTAYPNLEDDETTTRGRRVDYILPSTNLRILDGGIWRPDTAGIQVSDHFPVWLDVQVPR